MKYTQYYNLQGLKGLYSTCLLCGSVVYESFNWIYPMQAMLSIVAL